MRNIYKVRRGLQFMIEKYQWHVLEHFTKERGFKLGAELGVRWGQTSRYLLENTDLNMIGVDLMMVQRDKTKPGQETYEHWPWSTYNEQVNCIIAQFPDRFKMMYMDTSEAAALVENKSLDFVFIDADHSYEGVLTDIKNWIPKVKGLVTGHDIDRDCVKQAVTESFSKFETRGKLWNNCWWAELEDYLL